MVRRTFHQDARQLGAAHQQIVRPAQAGVPYAHVPQHVQQRNPCDEGQMPPADFRGSFMRRVQGNGEGGPQAAFLPYPLAVESAPASGLHPADGDMPRGERAGQVVGGKSLGPFMIGPVAAMVLPPLQEWGMGVWSSWDGPRPGMMFIQVISPVWRCSSPR